MTYLPKDRPPVEPTEVDVVVYMHPGKSFSLDIAGRYIFYNEDGTNDDNIPQPDPEEVERILSIMKEEWKVFERQLELRRSLDVKKLLWELWKDIDSDKVSREGNFYTSIKVVLNEYFEHYGEDVYPYDMDQQKCLK